ncbi:nickel pincer cofactor biosynthesis protein LarB [Pseudonocardia sp. RS11V-5]|uniref:nickel pincer cofactor biosynthesis protein LarB n=1 Tax=Pseudonocardia terrae TaxID=2905831 RepID=UPI001E32F23A|nr:nickel pincer cofactor biosynthesis protein LarB [Pseudonocardia terrae]MCE3552691.1 nickel pincer cofactor biosynthesis protein LarB [Pseudonocardia terrae]
MSAGRGFDDLGYARPDTDREARFGLPEVIFGPGKTPEQVAGVARSLLAAGDGPVLVTRIDRAGADRVLDLVPGGRLDEAARLLRWREPVPLHFRVAVVAAGTSDGPVAVEAAAVARAVGLEVERIDDVGVAGLHRLLAEQDRIAKADAVVCIAGMEGALPSVVAGLVAAPVIAVPTSVGYGAALEGVTALLAMLTSCAAGITVVNIDSGFGAALAAFRIARSARRSGSGS